MAKSASEKSAVVADIASTLQAGGDVATAVVGILASVNDQNKRRAFEQNFAALNLDQQEKLSKLLLDANSETERLAILTQALTASSTQRISNIASMYAEAEKKKRNQKLIIGGGILFVGLVAVVLIIKKV